VVFAGLEAPLWLATTQIMADTSDPTRKEDVVMADAANAATGSAADGETQPQTADNADHSCTFRSAGSDIHKARSALTALRSIWPV